MVFKPGRSEYRIVVENPNGVNRGVVRLELDGVDHTGRDIAIVDDGAVRQVRVVLG
jgi:cyclic beta-1,2-glucan synthetase